MRLIIETLGGRAVGAIDLFDFDPFHFRAGIGILIHNLEDRHKGYATDALRALCDYARDYLRVHQLYANICEDNLPSIQLFENAGFTLSGTKKDWVRRPDGWKSELIFQKIFS
jgi:diamine N-acetyltransferase